MNASRISRGSSALDETGALLRACYGALLQAAGHRGWWPGRTRLEIILGAILTQNTAWKNVEKAISALRSERALQLDILRDVTEEDLASMIRPSGYFRQKAKKIRAFITLLDEKHGGSLERMSRRRTGELRDDLLSVWGIGPETADSILLYAFRRPVFVVDAYTIRVLSRHGLVSERASYGDVQRFLMNSLPQDVALYNDFHAQFVWMGHHHCRPVPKCEDCPLAGFPAEPRSSSGPGA